MAYAALGKEYTVAITDWSIINKRATFDVPAEDIATDVTNAALATARSQLPSLVDSIRSDVTFTVAKGALVALGIGGVAIVLYKYASGK